MEQCKEKKHILTFHYNKVCGSLSFQNFFVWALLLIVHTWNSSPIRSNLLRLQCTCCTVPTTSGRSHGSPLVWACQWPSTQSLSSPQFSHNNRLWALGKTLTLWPINSLPSLNLLCYSKTDARFMQDAPKEVWSIPYVSVACFSKFKTEFYCILFF